MKFLQPGALVEAPRFQQPPTLEEVYTFLPEDLKRYVEDDAAEAMKVEEKRQALETLKTGIRRQQEAHEAVKREREEAELSGRLTPDAEAYYELAIRNQITEAHEYEATQKVPVVQGLLERGTTNWIAAGSGTFKSFVSADLAFRYGAEDMDYYGMKMTHGRALIILAEGASGYAHRKKAWEQEHGREVKNVSFLPHAVQLGRAHEVAGLAHYLKMEKEAGRDFGLVVIDTQAMSTVGVDENSSDMNAIIAQLGRIRDVSNACVVVIHHFGKDKRSGMRGSSMLYAAADTIIVTKREEGAGMTVTLSTSPVDGGKQKDLQSQDDFLTLEMTPHAVSTDYFGDTITSLAPVKGVAGGGSEAAAADIPREEVPRISGLMMFYLKGLSSYGDYGASPTMLMERLREEGAPDGHQVGRSSTPNKLSDLRKKGLVDKPKELKGWWRVTPMGLAVVGNSTLDPEIVGRKSAHRESSAVSGMWVNRVTGELKSSSANPVQH